MDDSSEISAKKIAKKLAKRGIVLLLFFLVYWPLPVAYLFLGVYDVMRQKYKDKKFLLYQYFLVNGTLTWIFSPINFIVDVISLPFRNKQVYRLEDLPRKHILEISRIISECPREAVRNSIRDLNINEGRSMILYKWYGFNMDNKYKVPLFHENFDKVLTIGVSSFKPYTSTTKHFGWLRAGIRVLINIDEQLDNGAYIEVNGKKHVWGQDGELFIFDDTVLHISHNQTDKVRNCLFIDVVRPSYLSFVLKLFIKTLGWLSLLSFYIPFLSSTSRWKVVR